MGKVCSINKNKKKRKERYRTTDEEFITKKEKDQELIKKIKGTMTANDLWYDQDDGLMMNELGMQEFEKGKNCSIPLALKYLLRAEKLESLSFTSAYYTGCIYLENLSKPEKSLDYFMISISKNPNWDYPYSKIGEAYLKLEMNQEALNYLSQGYNLSNPCADLLNNFGLALYNNNSLQTAQTVLEECIQKNQGHYKAYNNLGNVYRKKGLDNEALKFYKESINLSGGKHLMAFINSSSIYLSRNNLIECVSTIFEAMEVDKAKARNLLKYCGLYQLAQHQDIKKAVILYENKEFQEGIDCIESILPKFPKNIALNCYLGMFYYKLGENEQAIKYCKKTIEECLDLPEKQGTVSNYFFKKAKDTLDFMGVDFKSMFHTCDDSKVDEGEQEEEEQKSTNADDFQEFDFREEPNFDTKNYLYTINSNSHYQKRKELERKYGPKPLECLPEQYHKDNHSDISESSIAQYDNFKRANICFDESSENYNLSDESSGLKSDISDRAMQLLREKIASNYANLQID
ncbi:unnamed protein product [Moneuplotes crassus]|uniref:Tetratricopeptide repeat protein n=1 Tax=Euplotes crassus TaxID=5936 RepID=A0AAD1UAY8_EUPCR|nr:unnamed protein product [Moneuplotes crassus]